MSSGIVAVGWFLWHTFDFITDMMLCIEWFGGMSTSLSETAICIGPYTNRALMILSIILGIVSLIGYGLYLYSSYQTYLYSKQGDLDIDDDKPWDWPKVCKLCFEDSVSTILNSLVIWMIYNSHFST